MHNNFLMHDIRSNRMSEKTINTVRRNDIGVLYGVMARAVAGLPAENGNSTFFKASITRPVGKKRPEPLCYFNSKFMNSPLHVLLFDSAAP